MILACIISETVVLIVLCLILQNFEDWDRGKHFPLRRTVSDSCLATTLDVSCMSARGGRNGPGTTPLNGGGGVGGAAGCWFGWHSPAASASLRSSLSEVNVSRESLNSLHSHSSCQKKPLARLGSQGSQNRLVQFLFQAMQRSFVINHEICLKCPETPRRLGLISCRKVKVDPRFFNE